MRSVNANLLEINQAKSRINQAKKEGKTPDPKDLELVKTEKQNAFAISQYTDIMAIVGVRGNANRQAQEETQTARRFSLTPSGLALLPRNPVMKGQSH